MAPPFLLFLLLLLLFGTPCRLAQKMLFVGKVVRVLRQANPQGISAQQRAPFAGWPSESAAKVSSPAADLAPSSSGLHRHDTHPFNRGVCIVQIVFASVHYYVITALVFPRLPCRTLTFLRVRTPLTCPYPKPPTKSLNHQNAFFALPSPLPFIRLWTS